MLEKPRAWIALWRHRHAEGVPCGRYCTVRTGWRRVERIVQWKGGYDVAVLRYHGREYHAIRRRRGEPYECNVFMEGG